MTKNRKKNLRKINKIIRKANNNILKDELWKGRFYIQQEEIQFYTWEDGSGTYAFLKVTFIDIKTGQTATGYYHIYSIEPFFASDLFMGLNNFIVEVCDVWRQEDVPSIYDKTIYRTDNSCPNYKKLTHGWYCSENRKFSYY